MMDGDAIVHLDLIMGVLWICSPHEVMHLRSVEMPSQLVARWFLHRYPFVLVAMAYLVGILEIAGAAQNVIFINGDLHIEVPKNPVKLPANIGVGMPALFIVVGHFGIPLGHR